MEKASREEILRGAMRHQDTLTAYAYAILRDWALAQDAVQEALIVASQKWETFEPEGDVFAWLRSIRNGPKKS